MNSSRPLTYRIAARAAALSLLFVTTAGAGIESAVSASALGYTPQGENGTVDYTDFGGGTVSKSPPDAPIALTYRPDLQKGHQFFTCTAQYGGTKANGFTFSAGAQSNVNVHDGTIHANASTEQGGDGGANDPNALATAHGKFTDTLTFNNASSAPATIKVKFHVSGSIGYTPTPAGPVARYHIYLALKGVFDMQGERNAQNPSSDSDTIVSDGWKTQDLGRPDPKSPAGTYTGTFEIGSGTTEQGMAMFIDAYARFGGFSNFSNTAAVELELPPSVTMTSATGVFLSTSYPRPANISTRGNVQTGERVMIVGFIVNGTEPKKVIVRGLGPSLASSGVGGTLADPFLEVHGTDSSGKDVILASNNNWKDTQATELQSSGFAPKNDAESAIITTLNPGTYTAILKGQNSGTGNGLVELYDYDAAANSSFVNLSTRGFVGTGDNVLIGGVIVVGNANDYTKLVIRAIGPTLTAAGIGNALQDPTLTLYNSNGAVIASNDDWASTQQAELQGSGFAPKNAAESAIIASLPASNYTAIVRGNNNSSGVGLVEVYHVQ